MSVDEVEPIEAEAEGGNAVAPQGTHLASTQTVTHEYLTQSGKVMRETVTTNQTVTAVMDFVYDESGKPFALNYSTNGGSSFTTYYYVLNLQGDVVKLIDQDGAVAAAYAYDAWGNILSQSGSMAEKNPLRYRGYYYDSETGFYYLQSRYYDPATRRFINADVYASTDSGDAVSCNVFAYCSNRPTMLTDPTGQIANYSVMLTDGPGRGFTDPIRGHNCNNGRTDVSFGKPQVSKNASIDKNGLNVGISASASHAEFEMGTVTQSVDMCEASVGGYVNTDKIGVQCGAYLCDTSWTFNLFGLRITVGGNIGVGGSIEVNPSEGKYGVSSSLGFGFSVSCWVED